MSTSDQKNYRANINELLQEAHISIRESSETQGGVLHELDPSHCRGRRALVFDGKEKGITVAVRVEVPDASPFRNQPVTSPEVLQLLGALTQSLQGRSAEAGLISGERGLEAIMVSNRLCDRSIDAPRLSKYLNRIQNLVEEIEPALSLTGQTVIESILQVRPVVADLRAEISRDAAMIVPTFDEDARDRLMRQVE